MRHSPVVDRSRRSSFCFQGLCGPVVLGKVGHVGGRVRLSTRQRGYFDALGVLICEVVLLAILLKAGSVLGTVDLSHFAAWLRATSPQRVVTAWLRLLGTAVSGWLLLTTVFYGARGTERQARVRATGSPADSACAAADPGRHGGGVGSGIFHRQHGCTGRVLRSRAPRCGGPTLEAAPTCGNGRRPGATDLVELLSVA